MPYVIAQFAFIILLAWPPMPMRLSLAAMVMGLCLFALGLGLFAWAYFSMPRVSFTVMPQPREGNELCTNGPYRRLRHPMYTAVLLCGLGAAVGYGVGWKWLALLGLALVLWLKLRLEEKALLARHTGYAEYRKHTRALIPGIL